VRRWAAMSDPVQSPSPRPTRVDTRETDLIGGSVTRDLLLRVPPWWKEGLLTTISTTIVPNSGTFAAVRRRPIYHLTCEDVLRQTGANPRPTSGGQEVAGSNPVSPTVKPQVRGGSSDFGRPVFCALEARSRGQGQPASSTVKKTQLRGLSMT
jgi:hypothetical protein